jgi:hypothetical protein
MAIALLCCAVLCCALWGLESRSSLMWLGCLPPPLRMGCLLTPRNPVLSYLAEPYLTLFCANLYARVYLTHPITTGP